MYIPVEYDYNDIAFLKVLPKYFTRVDYNNIKHLIFIGDAI